jgi:3-oxoadipate enol-lactonase
MAPFEPAPEPPVELPPARTVHVRGRGEFFLRDSGPPTRADDAREPTVMLLHGWIATADLNWATVYGDLIAAGYRVLAIDHRGHGRGLRPLVPFRLDDCAADVAGVLRTLALAPALIVGYSMGGAIAQLVARDHPDVVAGLVLSGTAQHWQEPELRRTWKLMGAVGFVLTVAPGRFWRYGFKRVGLGPSSRAAWMRSEMLRHSARGVAEAGRELGRFDSRPWLRPLPVPTAVVVTSLDDAVPPTKQLALAAALNAPVFDAPIRHLEVTSAPETYNPVLLEALSAARSARPAGPVGFAA